ncbi:MAG: hypothetical protein K8R10_06245 [Rhodocyclales bacterium]|nr:hypothetical protein [Rhodocyclales bacterium]
MALKKISTLNLVIPFYSRQDMRVSTGFYSHSMEPARHHMPDHISFEELYRKAITFPGPNAAMAGLSVALETIEDELAHAGEQARVRLRARHQREIAYLHPEDREDDEYALKVTVEQVLPRVFRGGFILMLWSVFEVAVKRMAEYACRERNLPSLASSFKHGNFLDAVDRAYTKNLGVVAFPDSLVREKLDLLRHVRNALIHHNGSVAALPESLGAQNAAGYAALGLQTYTDLHDEFFVPHAAYLTENFAVVENYLALLSERVYASVHPVPAKDTET